MTVNEKSEVRERNRCKTASRGIWRLAIKKIRGFCEAKPQDFFTKTSSPAVLRSVQRKPLRFYTEFSLVSIPQKECSALLRGFESRSRDREPVFHEYVL